MVEAELKVLAGRSNMGLAQEIADSLGIKLGGIECKRFSDG